MTALGAGWIERDQVRLVVVDRNRRDAGAIALTGFAALPGLLGPGDVVVVNDAATLPAALRGTTADGAAIEARLVAPVTSAQVEVVLLGAGDHTTPTEQRPAPPALGIGDRVRFGAVGDELDARVIAISGRRATLALDREGDALWQALYRAGRPVQYAHRREPLPLWAVQTAYAGRPWASEMPSAGRPLTWALLLALRRGGVAVATLTHAAGLSSTGDAALDAGLPWPERYDIPARTAALVNGASRTGGRVIAVGTTVVRALEAAALARGGVVAGTGVAELVITPAHVLRAVDGVISGLHGPTESHHRLLRAFATEAALAAALATATAAGLQGHELGDAMLIAPDVLPALAPTATVADSRHGVRRRDPQGREPVLLQGR